ncbi:DNA-processing protein DprA [Anaeromicropila herbilytica]|uniref:DNA processing protein DprA n=1 Tax=Anaeromicropila herbilytica TaxID=2785025 RepID=A0A7R7EMJ8_9FIRM|nr:DNA-processing protein DprA [Anaeromicropila herbilytica]BCN31542.1 DNA processing protein DprA [Anaeromicropila herbilytica]
MECTEKEYQYWLYSINGIGIKKVAALLDNYNCAKEVFDASENSLKKIGKLNEKDVKAILYRRDIELVKRNYEKLHRKGIHFIIKEEKEYPSRLKHIYDSPNALYVRGKLPKEDEVTISIVGARNCSEYGKELAKYFASEMAKCGIGIISGLARGIDSFSHMGALKSGGITYGILGCGIDWCYPAENISLYMEMIEKGGVISEYGPGISPKPGLFPMRNRIISGMSDGILVVEAKEKSGSLITVDMGLEQGKNVYAIPGKITDPLSTGCNNLIKMGAKLVTNPIEIIDDYIYSKKKIEIQGKNFDNLLETYEKIVYANLSLEPKHLNEIIDETKLDINIVVDTLLSLELKSYVKEVTRNYYSLTLVP